MKYQSEIIWMYVNLELLWNCKWICVVSACLNMLRQTLLKMLRTCVQTEKMDQFHWNLWISMNLKLQKGKKRKTQKIGSVSLKSLDFNAPEKTTKRRKKNKKLKKWISSIEISRFQWTWNNKNEKNKKQKILDQFHWNLWISMHLKKQQKGKKTKNWKNGSVPLKYLDFNEAEITKRKKT